MFSHQHSIVASSDSGKLFYTAGAGQLFHAIHHASIPGDDLQLLPDHIQNAIRLQLDRQGIQYKLKENAFVDVDDPEALQKAALSLDVGRGQIFRFDK